MIKTIKAVAGLLGKICFWCLSPLISLYVSWRVKRDPVLKRMREISEQMKEADREGKDELFKQLHDLMSTATDHLLISRFSTVIPKEFIIKKGCPPYPKPKRIFKYVDDYYTNLWGFNSHECGCCKKKKPVQDFRVKRHDYRRRGLIKHSHNCKECLVGYKQYKKSIGLPERLFDYIERLLTPLSKESKEILAHNKKLDSLSREGLSEI